MNLANANGDTACSIAACLEWQDIASLLRTNCWWGIGDNLSYTFWRMLCDRLCGKRRTRQPPLAKDESWKALFLAMWSMLELWMPPEKPQTTQEAAMSHLLPELTSETLEGSTNPAAQGDQFSIAVCVRLRPELPGERSGLAGPLAAGGVTIPLHQKLQLLRARHGCSPRAAQRYLWGGHTRSEDQAAAQADADGEAPTGQDPAEYDPYARAAVVAGKLPADKLPVPPGGEEGEGCGTKSAAGGEATAPSSPPCGSPDNPRARAYDPESTEAAAGVLTCSPSSIIMVAPGLGLRQFDFDTVLEGGARQEEVYRSGPHRIVRSFLDGTNGTIFCFGQTGSGKTHTMFGSGDALFASLDSVDPMSDNIGIVPRACREVLRVLESRRRYHIDCQLAVSYVEVFGDQVSDLLREGAGVGAWQGVAARAVLKGHADVPVRDPGHLRHLLEMGEKGKRRAATAMNERSSRAHSLLLLSLTQHNTVTGASFSSRLCLADLGGSEQMKKSGAHENGERMREAVEINLGLLALRSCIDALNAKRSHVPYHDSKLTVLLQSALGGDSRTLVVVTAQRGGDHALETMQAFRFGERCLGVWNEASLLKMVSAAGALDGLQRELQELEVAIQAEERWEGGRPVGAEHLRERYGALMEQRRRLFGS